MADKLRVDTGGTDIGKKLWDTHQKNEYLAVNEHKEGFCWRCEKKKAVAATLFNVCSRCLKGKEHVHTLVTVADKGWDLCMFHGKYTWDIKQINARLCNECHLRLRKVLKEFRKAGGTTKVDPFWMSMRKQQGKDFLFREGITKNFRK